MGIFHEAPVPLAGLCLLVALLSFVTGVYAWLPFAHHASSVLFPMHLATMALLFCVFLQVFKHNVIAFGHRTFAFPRVSLPRTYWVVLALSCVGFLATFIGAFLYYPQHTYLGSLVALRIFSPGWLFLSFGAAGFAQWAGLRLRAYKAAA